MADNTVLNLGSGGDTISTDDVGGSVKVQRVKVQYGADGSATDASATTPLPTTESDGGIISTANSTASTLLAAAAFTGTAEDVSDYTSITVSVISDQASGTDGLSLQQSHNSTNWDFIDAYTIPAATGKQFSQQITARYFRVVYTNGGTNQGSFRLQAIFHKFQAATSVIRPQDARSNENDMQEVIGYAAGYNGTSWDRLRTVNTGVLQVAPSYAGTVASTGVGASGAQTQRVVTATDSTIGTVTTVSTVTTLTTCTTLTNITNWGNVVDNAGFTDGTTRVSVSGYIFDETAGTALTENDAAAARIDSKRAQVMVFEDETTRGQRATVNTSKGLHVTPVGHTSGGLSQATGSIGATVTAVKASAGQVYGWYFYNANASVSYVQFFNTATGGVTLGTTTPVYSLGIPPSSGANVMLPIGIAHSTAITIAITTTRAGSTGPGSTVDYNVFYV